MPEWTIPSQICPYLGLIEDSRSRFSFPDEAHRCFAANRTTAISLEHQTTFCFDERYPTCPLFSNQSNELSTEISSFGIEAESQPEPSQRYAPRQLIVWGLVAIITVALFVYSASLFFQQIPGPGSLRDQLVTNRIGTPTPPITPANDASLLVLDNGSGTLITPIPTQILAFPDLMPTSVPDGAIYTLSPEAADIGWVVSSEERGNHFEDSFLYAGMFNGDIYQSAFQFDLSPIPRGAPIYQAFLQLTGLQSDHLGQDGTWLFRLVSPDPNVNWRSQTYQDIFNASPHYTLNPILGTEDLVSGKPNIFELNPTQIRFLSEKIINDEAPTVSFRIDGPLTGADNLFAWDSGYGPKSEGNKVSLILNVGHPRQRRHLTVTLLLQVHQRLRISQPQP